MRSRISEKRQKLLDAYANKPFEVGEMAYFIGGYSTKERLYKISKLNPLMGTDCEGGYISETKLSEYTFVRKLMNHIGNDPFSMEDHIKNVAFDLGSILNSMRILRRGEPLDVIDGVEVSECNVNPYVYLPDGKKEYYQRGYCWTLQDKQNLVESIYQGVTCGKILVRIRSYNEVKKQIARKDEPAYRDIVDGKQRLEALRSFIDDEFMDLHGNFYSDLSGSAQRKFTDNQLISYAEIPEDSPDEVILRQFLKLNFSGVIQSTEHLNYVRGLYDRFGN